MALVNGRTSTIKIGASEYGDIMSIGIEGADKGQLSFTDLQNGDTKEFTLTINAKVDMAVGGLWRAAYDAAVAGGTQVISWAPYGNTDETSGQPIVRMTGAYVDGKPSLSITASQKDKATVDIVFLVDDYTIDITP